MDFPGKECEFVGCETSRVKSKQMLPSLLDKHGSEIGDAKNPGLFPTKL
jgi:hypothetical protein